MYSSENLSGKERSGPGWVERIGYGLGCTGITMLFSAISDYIVIYMTDVALLDIAVISTILAVSRFFDGISDLTVGHILDRTSTPLGRARPWLLATCIPFAITGWLLFRVPGGWPSPVIYIYVFIMYNLVNTVFLTFLQISSYSMVFLMSEDKEEQGLLSVLQSAFTNAGILLSAPLFVKIMLYFSGTGSNQNAQRGYSTAMLLYGTIMILLVLICVFTTRERAGSPGRKVGDAVYPEKKADILRDIKILLSDRYWLILTISQIVGNLGVQCLSMGSAYYATYILNDMGQMSWMTATLFAPAILIKAILPLVIKKIGKRRAFAIGYALQAAGSLGFGLIIPWKAGMIVCNSIRGIGVGFTTGIQLGIVADLVSKTEEEKGVSLPGLGNAGFSTANKLGKGLGSVCFGFAMAAAGFSAASGSQTTAPSSLLTNVISTAYCWGPMIIFAIEFILFAFFFNYEKSSEPKS